MDFRNTAVPPKAPYIATLFQTSMTGGAATGSVGGGADEFSMAMSPRSEERVCAGVSAEKHPVSGVATFARGAKRIPRFSQVRDERGGARVSDIRSFVGI